MTGFYVLHSLWQYHILHVDITRLHQPLSLDNCARGCSVKWGSGPRCTHNFLISITIINGLAYTLHPSDYNELTVKIAGILFIIHYVYKY